MKIQLENFKILEHGQVLRQGNEKIVLLIAGDPYAAIIHGVLYVMKFHHQCKPAQFLLDTIAEFEQMYRWAHRWQPRIESREMIDNLTISF